MSIAFELHTPETAPEAARPILAAGKKAYGAVPNLYAILAQSPAALKGYTTLWSIFDESSFTPAERQVVYLTSNYENECRYCMAGHSVLAKMAGLSDQAIAAIRDGGVIDDRRLQALHRFTGQVVANRGFVSDAETEAFLAAGFDRQQVLEVILGAAVKLISNYTNHVADTPLDPFMANTVWEHPSRRSAAA